MTEPTTRTAPDADPAADPATLAALARAEELRDLLYRLQRSIETAQLVNAGLSRPVGLAPSGSIGAAENTELVRLRARLATALRLHEPFGDVRHCTSCGCRWPCETARALGAVE